MTNKMICEALTGRVEEWKAEQRWLVREKHRIEARLRELAEILKAFGE